MFITEGNSTILVAEKDERFVGCILAKVGNSTRIPYSAMALLAYFKKLIKKLTHTLIFV
ncbi:hypothetical protein [Alkalihalobacterium alkalinitrilicum]|uniref:hypothetical protein n=1 Tax=Alkalihalobacterium alkalinitrilicum TaxID=427920 RepID=UPI001C57A769|nr:hypothetical protein [Alkalihalobacterium alkalinitrilicum]